MSRALPDAFRPIWTLMARDGERVAVPRTPLLVRLRQIGSDAFLDQPALAPLKRFLEACFVVGPVAVLAALWLERVALALMVVGVAALTVSAFYWFTTHGLAVRYLRYRGFAAEDATVEAPDWEAALAVEPARKGRARR